MRRLIVDTGPLVALANKAERRHSAAVAFFDRFDGALITTLAVIGEVCALLPRHRTSLFLRGVASSNFTLVHEEARRAELARLGIVRLPLKPPPKHLPRPVKLKREIDVVRLIAEDREGR